MSKGSGRCPAVVEANYQRTFGGVAVIKRTNAALNQVARRVVSAMADDYIVLANTPSPGSDDAEG